MTHDVPLVSVIIPLFRAGPFLEEALASVAAQSLENWEVIAVEDSPDDPSEAIVAAFALSHPGQVHYVRHPENRGRSAARNTAMRQARGTWFAFLDQDDWWAPEHLAASMQAGTGGSRWVAAGCWAVDGQTGKRLQERSPGATDLEDTSAAIYWCRYVLQPTAALIHRDVYEAVGEFDEDRDIAEDWDYWVRILRQGFQLFSSGCSTAFWRVHAASESQASGKNTSNLLAATIKHFDWKAIPAAKRHRRVRSLFLAAVRIHWRRQPHRATRFARQGWLRYPWRLDLGLLTLLLRLRAWVQGDAS